MSEFPTPWQALVPQAKHAAVARAFQSAFQTSCIASIAILAGGRSSALVYKVEVEGASYVLRVIQEINALNDPVRQFACMRTAADVGVAPRVLYTDAEDAVSITEFIPALPIREMLAAREVVLARLGEVLRTLQATPPFPELIPYMDGVDQFITRFHESGILPEEATREHFRYYAAIQQAYPRHDPYRVSCHHDLNPGNLLFDGTRLWIVDWESAFRNDRYADLANAANYLCRSDSDQDETILLTSYFGQSPDDYQRARFYLMRPVCYMFYAMAFLHRLADALPLGTQLDPSMETPSLREFHLQLMGAEDPLASQKGQLLYAKILLNQALHLMQAPRFAESLRLMD